MPGRGPGLRKSLQPDPPPSEWVAQFLNLKTQSTAGRMTEAGDFGRCVAL